MEGVRLIHGDSQAVLPTLETASVDSIVSDPPYALGFMGKKWDAVIPSPAIWRECFRVLKPGHYMLAFGGTRTFHRLMVALEDAGFEPRDTLCWLHGQGFPKGKSCLKPAWEPILLVRKPGGGKMKPLGIDECRIGTDTILSRKNGGYGAMCHDDNWQPPELTKYQPHAGRYPANLVLSHVAPDENGEGGCVCVGTKRVKGSNGVRGASTKIYGNGNGFTAATGEEVGYADADGLETVEEWHCVEGCPVRMLDEQAGPSSVTGKRSERSRNAVVEGTTWGANNHRSTEYTDSGNVSRFFYCAKASRRDRGEDNTHPTVKSTALMSWLVKLVTPPGGLCLDPFAGSGTTGVACVQTGRRFVGIEIDEGYYAIAQKRIAEAQSAHPLFAGVAK